MAHDPCGIRTRDLRRERAMS